MRPFPLPLPCLMGCLLLAGVAPWAVVGTVAAPALSESEMGRIRIEADRLQYDRDADVVVCEGQVRVERDDVRLTADRVVLDRKTGWAVAEGRVTLTQGLTVWEGERLEYNMQTRDIRSDRFEAAQPPYRIWAGAAAKTGTEAGYDLRRVQFTTCTNPLHRAHYHLWAARAHIEPGAYISARHAVLFLGPVPVFYTPYLRARIGERGVGIIFKPGYESRMGGILLSGLTYGLGDGLDGRTFLDYRTARGVAGGQEIAWKQSEDMEGVVHGYYAQDIGVDNSRNNYPTNRIPDESRYRLFLRHAQAVGAGWRMMGEMNLLSDEFVLEDFYKREYRQSPEPLNFVTIYRNFPNASLSAMAKWRMNDFYTTVSRLPEVRYEHYLTALDETGWYHEGDLAVAYLRREWAAWRQTNDEDVVRLDTRQFFSYPMRYFGFLNVTPRTGIRATLYSASREREEYEIFPGHPEYTGDGTNPVRWVRYKEGGAILRPLLEAGAESSFKAFGYWSAGPPETPLSLRHIVEPYGNLTLRPNLLDQEREEFYQFDETDRFGPEHSLRLGVRQTLQTRREGGARDALYLDLYATYYASSWEVDEGLGPLVWKTEVRPSETFLLDSEGRYDWKENQMEEWNIRTRFRPRSDWAADLEYRDRRRGDRQAQGLVRWSPNTAWTFEVFARYDADDQRLAEHGYEVLRMLDCLGLRFGISHEPSYTQTDGRRRDDEFHVWTEVWLTAFPQKRWGRDRWGRDW